MDKNLLAVNQYKDLIIDHIVKNKVVVVEAPTGSGKTTQIPQILFNAGLDKWGVIGVTQPRRIAAYGVSKRISEEMQVELGQLVGYKMRFDDCTSNQTKIKIMTDGILLEELRSDPLLKKYSIIIVDEAHERSLNIDFILGLLKNILTERDDFKVVVSSATINAKLFSDYFDKAPIVSIETKPFPVEEVYMELNNPDDQLEQIEKIEKIVKDIIISDKSGDILIFLPGEGPIKDCCNMLDTMNFKLNSNLVVLPLYSRLSPDEQNQVFNIFPGKRKVVVATNIAETSITIDGIVYVIDCGFVKLNYYNPRTFTSYLETKPISKASSDQRRGRAGRTQPGVVYRLYSKEQYEKRDQYTKEEIYRTDLSEVVLRMADLGIYNYDKFDFISQPGKNLIMSAVDTLVSINALDKMYMLTDIGRKMVDYPLMPRHSRILVESINRFPEVMNSILIIISFLSAKTPFLYPRGQELESQNAQRKLYTRGGDFFTWLTLFHKFVKAKNKEDFCNSYFLDVRVLNEIVNIHYQLCSMLSRKGIVVQDKFDYDKIILCIASGLKQYICMKEGSKKRGFKSMTETDIRIHPGSFVYYEKPDWIIGGEIINTGRTYLRSGAVLSEKLVKSHLVDVYNGIVHGKKASLANEEIKKDRRKDTKFIESVSERKKVEEKEEFIEVFDKYFKVQKFGKEKFIDVPYHILIQLKDRKDKMLDMNFGKLKAKLTYKNVVIIEDYFEVIIRIFDHLDLENGINTKYPKEEFIIYPDDWNNIFIYLKYILKPTIKSKNKNRAYFLSLVYLGENQYSYVFEKDFFNAVDNSLDALTNIFDEDVEAYNENERREVESIYSKLNNLLEQLEI